MPVFENIVELIGKTPLVKIIDASQNTAEVVAKLEYQNPGGSVKDRLAWGVIRQAERDGQLRPGSLIVEATSGNTGIGLAMIAAAKGYRLVLTMPDTMSQERRKILAAYGAELILTPGSEGMKGAIRKAEDIAKERDGFQTKQFDNDANVAIHYETTGPEIAGATYGEIQAFVAGVGTGGTLTGTGKYLKEHLQQVEVIAVEPDTSPVLSGGDPGPHKIQGIGAGFIPSIVDTSLIDGVEKVSLEQALETSRYLATQHGLLSGISAGANIYAASQVAKRLAKAHGTGRGLRVVTIIPSNGERYLSTILFEHLQVAEALV